ncbi:hypothetical protein [uncultured Marivirga sp.]|uniref:hypothetical protein n=1 Tax=uncultured Marivirga sp. TaxID=1123707 RepID=UPI0030ED176B|tara:strand:- start:23828 stop:24853 length:1026 start_codon:yes stop_codon:yes gene_type:complete
MSNIKKGKFEQLAWILLSLGIIIMIIVTVLFFLNRDLATNQPINGTLFGQYGSLIGGLIGTIVALVSFLLLYETLNEQRRQSQKQGEDQIFYRILDKQQNRIINSTIEENSTKYHGYQFFSFLTKEYKNRVIEKCHLLSRKLICDEPENIDNFFLNKLFNARDNNPELKDFELFKQDFISELKRRDKNDRWEYLKYYFGSVGQEPPNLRSVLIDIGTVKFYKINFDHRKEIYKEIYSTIKSDYGYFIDHYTKELEFFALFIKESLNQELYISYLVSQSTIYETVIVFYYLASGFASNSLMEFVIENQLLDNLINNDPILIDYPSREELENEIENIKGMYND